MIKFYADVHISKAVVTQLRAKNIDIVHCSEVGMANATDLQHLEYATEQGRVIITHDSDFLILNNEWQKTGKTHTGIFFCHHGLQGTDYAGVIIKTCAEYHELISAGAGTLEDDINNRVIFVS